MQQDQSRANLRQLFCTQTIYTALKAKLGRQPTHRELCDDVKRILDDSLIERAGKGQLKHQRRR